MYLEPDDDAAPATAPPGSFVEEIRFEKPLTSDRKITSLFLPPSPHPLPEGEG